MHHTDISSTDTNISGAHNRTPQEGVGERSGISILMVLLLVLGTVSPPLMAQDEVSVPPTTPVSKSPTETDQKAAELAQMVAEKLALIPDPRTLKREDLPAVFLILDDGIDAGRRFVREYPDSELLPKVCIDLSRLLILNVDRHIGLLAQASKESGAPMTATQRFEEQTFYLSEVIQLARTALSGNLPPSQICRAEIALGDALLKSREPAEAAKAFSRALLLDLSAVDGNELRIREVEALELAGEYPAMLKSGLGILEDHSETAFLPHVVYFTHKACRHLGKLSTGRDLWRTWGPVLDAGKTAGAKIKLPGVEQAFTVPEGKENDFAMMADRAGFYEGFYQLALGEKESALQALLAFNDSIYERINSGDTLSMPTKTYFEFQSIPMSQRIDVLHGKKAPSLDGVTWIQDNPLSADSKLELRIFCDSSRGNNRQGRFLDIVKKLEAEFSSQGLSVVWISGVLREERGPVESAAMMKIAQSKNLGWKIGVQAGQDKGVLDRHLVSHGGTILFLLDAEKKIRWEVIDPMFWDEGLYRTIIRSLLASGS